MRLYANGREVREMRDKGMTYEGSGTATYPCTILQKGPVVNQHAAAQGYASRVFPACLRHLNKMSNHLGPTEPPASGLSRFSVCRHECVGLRLEQHTPAGGGQWPYKLFL